MSRYRLFAFLIVSTLFVSGCSNQVPKEILNYFLGEETIQSLRNLVVIGVLLLASIGIGLDLLKVILSQAGLSLGFLLGDSYSFGQPINFPQFIIILLSRFSLLIFVGILISHSNSIVNFIESFFSLAKGGGN